MKAHFYAAEPKMNHRRDPLDALDHAGCDSCEEQLGRIEGVRPATDFGIEQDISALAAS
jgi:hypothetical protein